MKRMMAERNMMEDEYRRNNRNSGIVDGSLLGFVFGSALVVIMAVSVYAFYNLYNAIIKKFTTKHDEL